MKVLERDIMRQVTDTVKLYGLDLQRRNTGGMKNAKGRYVAFGKKGDADWSGMIGSRKFDLEVKRPGKRPSPEQYARLRRTNSQGGVGMWVDDGAVFARCVPKLLAGWRAEIDAAGDCWITDEA
jgi:hypothetical protein